MNWTEIGKVAAPATVGAASAILSAWLTNLFAERRHRRELQAKERELEQRALESLIPHRIDAYRSVFSHLQSIKTSGRISLESCDALIPELLWVDPAFAKEVVKLMSDLTSGEAIVHSPQGVLYRASNLQEQIRGLVGAQALNKLFEQIQS